MFCFDEFAFTVPVKHKINSIQNSWLYFDMFVFYDWPFAHVYFAKNVAYIPFNSWLSFNDCAVFYDGDAVKVKATESHPAKSVTGPR